MYLYIFTMYYDIYEDIKKISSILLKKISNKFIKKNIFKISFNVIKHIIARCRSPGY